MVFNTKCYDKICNNNADELQHAVTSFAMPYADDWNLYCPCVYRDSV